MKSAIIFALAGAVIVFAQTTATPDAGLMPTDWIPQGLPQCAYSCAQGMWENIVKEFKCDLGDTKCACSDEKKSGYNFAFGFLDCGRNSCGGNVDDANKVAQLGGTFCSAAGVPVSVSSITSIPPTPPAAAPTTPSATVISTFTTIVSSGGSAVSTSTGTTTVSGAVVAPAPTSGGSVTVSTGNTVSATGPSTAPTDPANTATDGASAVPSSSSSALGSQATVGPMAGLLAAAGLAAALL